MSLCCFMVGPNPKAQVRVLVYDPNDTVFAQLAPLLHLRFGNGSSFSLPRRVHSPDSPSVYEQDGVSYTVVATMQQALNEVLQRNAPHYSLVAYDIANLKQEQHPGIIADVRKHDFFLPQIAIGITDQMGLVARCARSGILHYANTTQGLQDELNNIFRRERHLANLTVVKIGGSAFDFVRQTGRGKNLEQVCETLIAIHQQREKYEEVEEENQLRKVMGRKPRRQRKIREVQRILVTAGAGQHGDVEKDLREAHIAHERMHKRYPQAIAEALQENLSYLKALFGDAGKLLTTETFYYIGRTLTRRQIPLIGTAPHYILARDSIPLQDSDTHTIALAEFYGAQRVVLVKRTDGIYDFDPYRGFVLDPRQKACADMNAWTVAQRSNRQRNTVTVEEMLSKSISREGTGFYDGKPDSSTGHLLEDSALAYFAACQHVREILVTHIAPEEMYVPLNEGNDTLALPHVVTGEKLLIDRNAAWQQDGIRKRMQEEGVKMLRRNLYSAVLEGKAQSRIVRGYEHS